MQTFLPFSDFAESAACLDQKRLGKQRVETLQLMKALLTGSGWANHPACKMWWGHERELMEYQRAVCAEWTSRGFKDTCLVKTAALYYGADIAWQDSPAPWLGNEDFHRSHRSNLLRKNLEHYAEQFSDVPDDLDYIWPEA